MNADEDAYQIAARLLLAWLEDKPADTIHGARALLADPAPERALMALVHLSSTAWLAVAGQDQQKAREMLLEHFDVLRANNLLEFKEPFEGL